MNAPITDPKQTVGLEEDHHGDEDQYPPEQLTTVQVRDPNEPHRMMTLPGLVICRNSEVPQLLEEMAGRSRWMPGS